MKSFTVYEKIFTKVGKSTLANVTNEYVQSGEETGSDGEDSEDFDKEAFIEAERFRCLWESNDKT